MKKEQTDLQRVITLAEKLIAKKLEVEKAEEVLKEAKARALEIERDELPLLMAELGLQEITLDGGQKITIKEDCDAKISEANKPKAFAWLLKNNFGGIIKTCVSVSFPKGEHSAALKVQKELAKQYDGVTLDENVHPATLKSFVKERMEKGEPVPADLFGVFVYSKAVIKEK